MLILTRYLPPTNTKGARVTAKLLGADGITIERVTIGFHAYDDAHDNAACALIQKIRDQPITALQNTLREWAAQPDREWTRASIDKRGFLYYSSAGRLVYIKDGKPT